MNGICKCEGCPRKALRKYCDMHRYRVRVHGEPGPANEFYTRGQRARVNGGKCKEPGCPIKARALGMCWNHYYRDYKRRKRGEGPPIQGKFGGIWRRPPNPDDAMPLFEIVLRDIDVYGDDEAESVSSVV